MVARVAFALFVRHNELLFVAFGVGRSNDNTDAALKNLVAKMLPGIVLKRCVILEFLRPFLTRPSRPRGLSMPLASRRNRLGERPQASTKWTVSKRQWNVADLLNKILVDLD